MGSLCDGSVYNYCQDGWDTRPGATELFGLSPGTFKLVATNRAAHLDQLSCSHFVATHVVFCLTNRRVKTVVSCDAQAYVKQQVDQAKRL